MKYQIILCLVIIKYHLGTSVHTRSAATSSQSPISEEKYRLIEKIWNYMELKVEEEGPSKGQGKGFTTKATLLPIIPIPEHEKMLKWLNDNLEKEENVEVYKISKKRFSNFMNEFMDERELQRLRWRLVNAKKA